MKKEFCYPSRDGVTQIHAVEWIPEGEVKGVLQICHGMVEYINRYHDFAEYMCERGYYVTGHDHLGHGKSIRNEEDYGYFEEKKGNQFVIGDIQKLREMTTEKYPDVPYYMLGHSMGSFLLRQYLTMYGKGLSGAIIMGTGYQGGAVLNMGQLVCRVIAAFKGWRYRSRFVDKLSFGSYNKRFEPGETSKDWITSDKDHRQKYVNDPLCSFMFTLGGYYQMFEGMKVLTRKESMERIPKDLPVLFVAGADDPVGAFGKGVEKVYKKYKTAGMQQVSMHLYEGDRHEILNETDREQVYEDLYQWIESL
ncbi:alpha/beta fold hydrolase [Bariatricus sp. SGI.161]|uniref:alpha/beta fold hydrolase n=1 Tax=Bariatricus sp. SGI.161 TaxID=3420550 RepID=UPI003D062F37